MKYTFTLAALAAVASGHTIFLSLTAGGTEYGVGYGIAVPSYDGPINDVTTPYIACNGGPNPTTPSGKVIEVKAGETVKAKWRKTLDASESGSDYVVDPSHKGPVMAYLKKVTDATTDSGVGGGWFKISEAGLNPATQGWAVTDLIANKGYQEIKIPSCIANGQYLLRAELIALHSAGSPLGAQFYMECAQINVSGGTGTANPATVSFPGAYGQNDPGIVINIYQNLATYKIPGPTAYTCGADSGPAPTTKASTTTLVTSVRTTTPAVVTTSAKSTTTPAVVTTSAKPTTTAASGAGAPLYGQCGGTGWTGPTTCAQGKCVANGAYYSQCTP